jgi:glycosyltransferase involved in cell wall biosynthesis
MKIALVARHLAPAAGHTDQHCADLYCGEQAAYVRQLAQALAGLGHHVAIYVRRDTAGTPDTVSLSRRLTVQRVPAGPQAQLPASQIGSWAGAFGSELRARWTGPDVVHAFDWTSGLAALVATRDSRIPVVQTFGSLGITEQRLGVGQPEAARLRMESCLARGAAAVVATSHDEASDLARLGVPGSRLTVVPGGVDVQRFSPADGARRPGAVTRLLHIGSLNSHQGPDTLIRAIAQLPGTELVIACGLAAAELEADQDCKKLGKLAAHLGVADRVSFTGPVTTAELPAVLRSADLLVSAARHVPLGLPAIAAMACGTPVLGYSTGAHADAIIDGTTGVLVPPGRPDLLARRLRDLLATPMRLMAYGIASADRAQSRYPWERLAGEAVMAYQRGISRAPGHAARADSASKATALTGDLRAA